MRILAGLSIAIDMLGIGAGGGSDPVQAWTWSRPRLGAPSYIGTSSFWSRLLERSMERSKAVLDCEACRSMQDSSLTHTIYNDIRTLIIHVRHVAANWQVIIYCAGSLSCPFSGTHTYERLRTYARTYVRIRIRAHIHKIHTTTYTYIPTYARMIHVRTYVRTYIRIYSGYIHTYAYGCWKHAQDESRSLWNERQYCACHDNDARQACTPSWSVQGRLGSPNGHEVDESGPDIRKELERTIECTTCVFQYTERRSAWVMMSNNRETHTFTFESWCALQGTHLQDTYTYTHT